MTQQRGRFVYNDGIDYGDFHKRDGAPVTVEFFDVEDGPCYRLTFEDGETFAAFPFEVEIEDGGQ